ncbi:MULTISPECIES: hypothetical protein [Calothrix]|uniref:Uncharacterized protein n=2 Tax=Calothrix TaxID=1186 RepID=A0ABR8A7N0_9CYAN|nr:MULTISPECIES: hypothetical protein [Calothrix]MBD2195883.1 hypothetical protein [Calothrix parietina FACHB-288]MBD2227597.1 hypothetical protein [Calothrix anomala FACHB-343]
MKKIAVISLFTSFLIAQSAQATSIPKVEEFKFAQITGHGCGMTLWKPSSTNKNRYILFNGLTNNSMEMLVNGKITKFKRIKSTGTAFYGQKTFQTFQSPNGKIIVDVAVKLGAKGEIETVAIKEGTVTVQQNGKKVKIPVVGDAGC